MRAGSWPSIVVIYAFGIMAGGCFSSFLPLAGDFGRAFGIGHESFALLFSLLALPAALLGAVGGAAVDAVGPRRALIFSALIAIAADAADWFATSLTVLDIIRFFEGLTMLGVFTAAPALLMATTTGRRQIAAMTLWSTYAPTGFSSGLAIAAIFAGTPAWRWTFVLHGALFALLAVLGLWLPDPPASSARPAQPGSRIRLKEMFSAFTEMPPVRLALTFGVATALGIGVATVMPSWLVHSYGLSIGKASNLLALANIVMIAGAYFADVWIGRGQSANLLFVGLGLAGSIAGTVLFLPGLTFSANLATLCSWLLITGAVNACVLALLPAVLSSPERGGAAAGLFAQVSSLAALLAPPLWLGLYDRGGWTAFAALIVCGWIVSYLLIPGVARRFRVRATVPAD